MTENALRQAQDSGQSWDDAAFVARCVKAAARKGWTAKDLAGRAGLAAYYFTKRARKGRRIDVVIRIARLLDVPLARLAGDRRRDRKAAHL